MVRSTRRCSRSPGTSEELLAKSLEEITHPDDLSADLEYVRRLLAGEISHYEMERRYFHARGT